MLPGLELVAGYLMAWAARKARRAGARLDAEADLVLDTELDRLHQLVVTKLGTDSALAKLEQAASAGEEVNDRTCRRVTDALDEAADDDPEFAGQIAAVLSALQRIAPATVLAAGDRAAAAGRDVQISAHGGSAAAQTMGDVTLGSTPPDPSEPGLGSG